MLGRATISAFFLLLWTATTIPALPLPIVPQLRDRSFSESISRPMMRRDGRRFATPTVKRGLIDKFITNAQRLTNGLAPLPPRWKTFKGNKPIKRRQSQASPVIPAPQPTETSAPSPRFESHTGYFAMRNSTGGSLGYLDRKAKSRGLVGTNDTASEALRVKFWVRSGYTNTSYSTVFMQNWENDSEEVFPLLALINFFATANSTAGDVQEISTRDNDTNDHDPVILFMGGSALPPDRSITVPQNLNNSFTAATGGEREVEPNVWSIDIASGEVAAHWTDSHAHRIPIQIVLVNNTVLATNNITALISSFPVDEELTPVTLHFIDITEFE